MCDSNVLKLILSNAAINSEKLIHSQVEQAIVALNNPDAAIQQLKVLSSLLEVYHDNLPRDVADQILTDLCLPSLFRSSENVAISTSNVIVSLICTITQLCFDRLSGDSCKHLLNLCLHSLEAFSDDVSIAARKILHMRYAVEMTGSLLSVTNDAAWKDSVFKQILINIRNSDDIILNQILRVIVPKILYKDKTTLTNQLESLWKMIVSIGSLERDCQEDHHGYSNRSYILMCSLADFFFPLENSKNFIKLSSQNDFWNLLQRGFYSRDPLTRKRALYLLKRILEITDKSQNDDELTWKKMEEESLPLFWWSQQCKKELTAVWDDYILLVETLEEKQVHVIKPLLPRLSNLEKATKPRENGLSLLHTSWLICVYRRMSIHESTYLMRWGVERFLMTDLTVCPLFQQGQHQFLHGELVKILTETTLFNKPPELLIGSCSPTGVALKQFFINCHEVLTSSEEKAEFLTQFLNEMARHHWGGSALVYISQALASIPRSQLLDQNVLLSIRNLLTKSLRTLEIHLRGAVQCNLLRCVLNLIDVAKVDPCHVFAIIALLKSDESFKRGTQSWEEVVDWLKSQVLPNSTNQNWSPSMLREYFDSLLSKILKCESDYDASDHHQMARALVLCADAGVLVKKEGEMDKAIVSLIAPALNVITSINTRAYMSHHKADTALYILVKIAQEGDPHKSGPGNDNDSLKTTVSALLSACMSEILLFIQRRTSHLTTNLDDLSSIKLYTDVVRTLDIWMKCEAFYSSVKPLVSSCYQSHQDCLLLELSEQKQVRRLVCLSILAAVCNTLLSVKGQHKRAVPTWGQQLATSIRNMKIIHVFQKPEILKPLEKSDTAADGVTQWGQVASDYITAQWTCIHWALKNDASLFMGGEAAMIDHCMEALNVCGSDAIPHIFGCIRLLLNQLMDPESIVNIFSFVWRKTFEETKAACFWEIFEGFISLIFQPKFLQESGESIMNSQLHLYAEKIFDIGEEKNGVVNVLVSHICELWQDKDTFCHALKYSSIVSEAIVFGNVHLKGLRHSSDTSAYVATLGEDCAANTLVRSNLRDDSLVRVHMISLLSHLNPENSVHVMFAKVIFSNLKQKLKSLNSQKSYRNFSNSLNHRQKHRALVAMLIMEPLLQVEVNLEETFTFAMDFLQVETQPSVRCQLEWLILRFIHRKPELSDRVWNEISHTSEKKSAYVCSLLNLMIHIGPLFKDPSRQESFFMQGLHCILPWCMAHHFNTRVFAEAALITLWQQCKTAGFTTIVEKYSIVDAIMSYQQNNSNALKTTQKLLENFFFTFDPMRDYSIETICTTLPRLTSVTDEEWLPWELFCQVNKRWSCDHSSRILLKNPSDQLNSCSPGNWRMKPPGVDGDNSELIDGDVQKKMMPWRCMLPEADPSLAQEYTKKQQRQVGQLVLVTSLVDKIPNLGGLCRTSEIFGVSEFIVGNIKNVDDKNFQSLSVTAHKWIPIKEVRPWFLKEYLIEMRDQGYTLVGVEQTANSCDLTDYTFPTKTLLLLGNEKEGLPVELIQFLDVCVEIPQQGFVRSLNVHVSGALLVWEYTRQQLLKLPTEGAS